MTRFKYFWTIKTAMARCKSLGGLEKGELPYKLIRNEEYLQYYYNTFSKRLLLQIRQGDNITLLENESIVLAAVLLFSDIKLPTKITLKPTRPRPVARSKVSPQPMFIRKKFGCSSVFDRSQTGRRPNEHPS